MNEFNENNNQVNSEQPQVITQDIQQPQVVMQENQQTQYATYQNIQPPNESKGMAIASMVLGIVSVVFACCYGVGGLTAIVGLILGIICLVKKKDGKGMALTGVILSGIALVLALIFILAFIGAVSSPEFWRGYYDGFNSVYPEYKY